MSRTPHTRLFQPRLLIIPALVAFGALALPAPAAAQYEDQVYAPAPPPELPVYDQPPLPAYGYIWTPGYWSYGPEGYFWVPGTWVQPPAVGLLWTPGYWGFLGGRYLFNAGYWGPTVGFYGGIDYGFGYGGFGYEGGYWRNGAFAYNREVNHFGGVHITNVYDKTVIRNVTVNRVSYNGPGGIDRRPQPAELAAMHANHVRVTPVQLQHQQMAAQNHALLASVNHGHPAILATSRPAAFGGPAPGAHFGAPAPHPVARPASSMGGGEMRPMQHAPAAPSAREPAAEPRMAEPRAPMQRAPVEQRAPAEPRAPMERAPVQRAPVEPRAPMMAPHPQMAPMQAPHPAMPHPAAAPHPGGPHEDKQH